MLPYSSVLDIPFAKNVLHYHSGKQVNDMVIFHPAFEDKRGQYVIVETFKYLKSCGGVISGVSETMFIEDARAEWKNLLDLEYEVFDMNELSWYEGMK